ncbi:4-alpha-glucanotransferase, chloroplastic/amyloplastic-like isoform X6 [Cornus florida]|uniref:4-alpha-glucanotransferase, chloroplastic/amyloplastic-like isoform X6 n=2 Tax=Cornus florida TaxID=4283 RepID=UPI00289B9B0E|nr:4-alpha-glucanotransferase, chloroplastic/amyloplastic-like isoform X6 [Cornus florida]
MQFNNSSTCSADLATVGEDLPVDYADWLPKSHPSDRRRAGVLLHPTSFPGPYGIGDLGDQTFRFLDWLHELVPLVPPGRKANEEGFPYSGQALQRQQELQVFCSVCSCLSGTRQFQT